jgi:predicted nuclease of predicted toxin-antitoxin system
MKIVADEGIERPIVVRLRSAGHDVIHIAEIARGITDPEVLEIANQNRALLITYDKDFGDLIFNQQDRTQGVMLVRLPETLSSFEKAEIVIDVISERQNELFHAFSVIAVNKRRTIKILQRRPEIDWPYKEEIN